MSGRTLFDKVWERHVIVQFEDEWALLHIDRHLLHDLSGTAGLRELVARNLPVHSPQLAFATPDHAVSTAPGRTGETYDGGAAFWRGLKEGTEATGIRFFDIGQPGQGIVHVMGPELGLVQPGLTLVCGDSHTCTNGALGAIAFGIGSSEVTHALATQTLLQRKPKTMRVRFEGERAPGVTAKDMILYLIGQIGAHAGTGYAIEYAGSAVRSLSVEERMTVCNLSIELGARIGMIAPDEKTFAYLKGRPFSPADELFTRAVEDWRTLQTDDDAEFDREMTIDAARIPPMITWGTSPEQVISVEGTVPGPDDCVDDEQKRARQEALVYMGLQAGQPIAGTSIDWVFIGSCSNSRLSDLKDAADVVRGKHIAKGVTGWIVPGSELVKRAAESEGLDVVFREAGFAWREPGCSMCVAANGERVAPGTRVVSTSNRNFVGRQGPGVRTHLASPRMAAAAAIAGEIVDVRRGI